MLDEKSVECELTTICLSYLASPWFDRNLRSNERERHAKDGYFSFQDYAVAKWSHHLDAFIKTGPSRSVETSRNGDWATKLSEVLANFAGKYGQELDQGDERESVPTIEEHCSKFRGYDFYDRMILLWAHVCKHQRASPQQRNKVSLESLGKAFELNREVLEGIASAPETMPKGFHGLYGNAVFKCDRTMCAYFYEGFESKDAREAHTGRHDRPYRCPVADCSVVSFGFPTNKDCRKHLKLYHPDFEATESGFIQTPRELIEEPKHRCNVCGQHFTRKMNRDDHVRSHYGDRPNICSTCDKPFVRKYDLRRHEKHIHTQKRVHKS